ncbi:chloramphenicol acetyltransferase [Flaviaesturariibacter flavus]|uniref:Chloramphenicol acetyltransferase n=1 Tax=Flaviaesturariibacter flavus TaxID=2502780 RepID=A0A4V2NVG1_9BACT|nr:chloramphenicol acetyltransferase [Flaviaesturariibacter flavus]TCJ13336.1 chloramphenicol acetyltransferase [Flaviaesturariibacter flavus]
MKQIDLESWNRKEHFDFFSSLKSPFFGITAEVDCTNAYAWCRAEGHSFFATYLHRSMVAVNDVPAFRLRLFDGAVYETDTIHAGTTIGREDGTFAFSMITYSPRFSEFLESMQQEIAEVKNSTGLRRHVENGRKDFIRHSTVPWLSFTAILHPTNLDQQESIPKITFGKFREQDGRKWMPVSVEAHHGLMDGLHIGQYFKRFQELLNQ